jgi:nitrogen fixation/metabolism regulation signal transduction histidine kinase
MRGMPKLTQKLAEEILQKEVQNLDKRVQIVAVNQTQKKDAFRITLIKDGKSGTSKINKDILKKYVTQEGRGSGLRKALGKAVGHLSIHFGR